MGLVFCLVGFGFSLFFAIFPPSSRVLVIVLNIVFWRNPPRVTSPPCAYHVLQEWKHHHCMIY